MSKSPTLFLSYCWSNSDIADVIEKDLQGIGLNIIRDKRDLKYKGSIKDFMKRVRKEDYALVLISNDYLRSKNCMYEINELFKDDDFNKKLLPVVLEDTNIYNFEDKVSFIEFWDNEFKDAKAKSEKVLPENSIGILNELREVRNILENIDSFIENVTTQLHTSFPKLKNNKYKELLEFIGFDKDGLDLSILLTKQIENIEEREVTLDQILKEHPKHNLANFEKAKVYFEKGEFLKARVQIEFYLQELNAKDVDVLNYYSVILRNNFRDINFAKLVLQTAIKFENNYYPALNNLGLLYFEDEKNYGAAVEYFEKALKINPDSDEILVNLGRIYLDYYKNFDIAENYFLQSISINNRNYQAFFNFGLLYYNLKKDYEKAADFFEESIKINSANPYALLNAAVCYTRYLKEYSKGKEYYKKYLKISPDDFIATTDLGYVHFMLENYDESLDLYKEALRMNYDYEVAHNNMANIYKDSLIDFEKAKFHYSEALRINPTNFYTKINMASLYLQHGKIEDAKEIFRNLIKNEECVSENYTIAKDFYNFALNLMPSIKDKLFDEYFKI